MRDSVPLLITTSFKARWPAICWPSRVMMDVHHHALFADKLAGKNPSPTTDTSLRGYFGQKTQAAIIDGHYRNLTIRQQARGRQQRSVAADNDSQIRVACCIG